MENKILHEVVITAIVIKDGKYLVTKRSMQEKRFPGMWTVPGGKIETDDYVNLPKDTEHYWYNVLEQVLRKEVRSETGLEIKNIAYVTSLARVHEDKNPSLVISCLADYDSGEIKLQEDETVDHAWVTLAEAKNYQLIDGIYDELVMAENQRKGIKTEWRRA
ncbi:MAG: NUDIX domain-containing protein [Candidatus Yanofskybacteria bacterium]|nr:NUDIX domain-containing protein [Candidatus Yanofskybacteria bacterium]